VSDPAGGFGWRSARHLPRKRAGVLSLGSLADRATALDEQPLCVLLLGHPLEALEHRDRLDDLLTGPGVVAVDPARVSYRALSRLPEALHAGLAAGQARRLRLPGHPRALVLFGGLQYPLARSLLSDHPDAELWLAEPAEATPAEASPRAAGRIADLRAMAELRADRRFPWPGDAAQPARERNAGLWERIEALGIASGRLGSERADVLRDGQPST
jgi:hypothetical protein